MDEFTKEELEHILFGLQDWCSPASTLSYYSNLKNKIESMIDNYCEHENGAEGYNCSECKDCGARW